MKKQNLNKENFFNELVLKYPKAMSIFCKWIDQYKLDNKWDEIFTFKTVPVNENEQTIVIHKFHHIPYAMQVGIIFQFYNETFNNHDLMQYNEDTFKGVFAMAMHKLEMSTDY